MGRIIPIAAIIVLGVVLVELADNDGEIMIPILGMALAAFIVAKFMEFLKLKATVGGGKKNVPEGEMRDRLVEIERRLTDVQDVMIALSEKIDRLETGKEREKLV